MQAALYFLFLLVAGISAKPLYRAPSPAGSCGSKPSCELPSKIKFAYEQGKTYTYEIQTSVKTSASSDSQSSGLQISAQAKIGAIENCELELELSSVELKDEQGNKIADKAFLDDLSIPLRFEWNDGRIGAVCPTDEDDSQWSLNFKRSVLSAFQNSMDSLDNGEPLREIDASGDCWANYDVESSDSNRKVIKWTKDLNQCADRQGGLVATHGIKYTNPMSDINTMPLTEGKQECTQTTEKRIIKQVDCKERLEFMPTRLAEGATIVITEATMRVKLVSENNEQAQAPEAKYTTDLKFDHSYVPANDDASVADAESLINKMCKEDGEVVAESGRDFSDLLDTLRGLDKDELASVYSAASKCKATQKMIDNIIPDVATTESSRFIVEKVAAGQPSESTIREDWMASLRGVLSPAKEILEKAATLLASSEEYTITGRAYLGVGSALNNFCAKNKDCRSVPEVQSAVARLAEPLSVCRSGATDRQTTRRALYALRALGNAGSAIAMEALPAAVSQCMTNKALPAELRLSALSVLRRVPCGHENEQASETLRTIMRDNSDDTEFRSYALVAAMRCPCMMDLEAVRTVITGDNVNEKFGAFVVSFVSRMEESPMSNYWEPEFRSTVSALMATRQAAELAMKVDALKTGISMNRQQFWPKLNAGYMYDVDVIHSDKAMFPRSARVNVSMAAFGRAINPIEIGLRQEGVESIFDAMPDMDVIEAPQGLMELPRINTDKLKPVLDKLKLSLYVRVFGSEVRYASVDKEVLDRLRQRLRNRIDIQSLSDDEGRQGAELFVDRALSLPTVAGLPIRLAVRGSYRSHVRPSMNPSAQRNAEGRVASFNIKADVKAGLSVELRQSMSAYIGSRQYGLQAVTRLVSKAEYQPEFIFEGRHLKIKVDMPSETIRAASLTNEITIRRDKTEQPISTDGAIRRAQMCTPGLTGLQICFQTEMPSRWQGVLTPGKIAMTFEKTDKAMQGVEVEFRADHSVNGEGKLETVDFKAYVDTPGSSKDRKLLAQLKVSRPEREISAALETPWKKAAASVKMTGDSENSEIKATLAIGEEQSAKRNYKVDITRSSSSVRDGANSYPKRNVEVTITRDDVPKNILKASGSVTDMGEKKDISVRVDELHIPNYYTMSSPASLNGEFGLDAARGYGFLIKGTTETRNFETEFGIKIQPEGRQIVYSHRLHHQSSAAGQGDDKFDRTLLWEVEFKREPMKILMAKSILRSMDVPFVDRANHKAMLRFERPTEQSLETEIEGELNDARRLKLSQKVDWHRTDSMRGFNYQLNIAASGMVDRTIVVSSHREWSPKALIQIDAEVRRGDIAIYHVSLFGRRDAPGYGELKFRTLCPYSDLLIVAKGEKTDEYTSVHSLRLERNGDLRINFESKARLDDERRDIDAKLELMGMAPIVLSSRGSGSPFDGRWQHDGSIAYGARKLLFGGNVQYKNVAENEGILDANVYAGTLERMFKQYINWHRVNKQVKVRGMTELGDDLYKLSAELDMAARRHRVVVEAPRGLTQITFGRLENQRGFDVAIDHSCSRIEMRLFAKTGLDPRRSDIAGTLEYRMPGEENFKTIGFKSGYKADMTEGIDIGFFSGVKVQDKEWFANSNVTVIPGRKIALAFGAGDGENFRHRFAVLGSRKWEQENVMRLDAEVEMHSTALQLPRLKLETYKKLSWNNEQRLGAYETRVQVIRGDKQMWYAINIDAMNPREAGKLMIQGDSSITKPVELSLSYTASLPTVTVSGSGRIGDRRGSMRGLIEVTKVSKENVDVSYSVSFYSARSQQAEISIRGQHQGNLKSKGQSFLTIEAKDFPYAINTRWNIEEEKTGEIIIRTPHENFRENVIRFTGRVQPDDVNGELLIKVGPSVNVRSTVWRKVDATSRRTEVKIDNNGRIWAVGVSLEHPEDGLFSRGEHRLRLRADTPIEGYKTSSVLLWINPASKGLSGIATVLGLQNSHSGLNEQRSQMQFAYQIGEEKKGGIMFSARAERNRETQKLVREASLSVKLPRFNFSIDIESTRAPEKGNGWIEYRSDRFGNWRAEWSGSGSMEKAGIAHVEVRGKMPEREEPVIIRLSSNHDLTKEVKEINGQIATSMPGYDRIRLRATQSLDEEGNIAVGVQLMMPGDKMISADVAFGYAEEQTDFKVDIKTPFEVVRELNAKLQLKKEDNNNVIDIEFGRNERKYAFFVSAEQSDDSVSGRVKIETPFAVLSSADGSYKRAGLFFSPSGSKTTAELTVNKATTLKVDSEGKFDESGKYIASVFEYGNERYILQVNKDQDGKLKLRMPTPWSCTIDYEGEYNTENNIYMALRPLHTCSPYSFSGEVTVSLDAVKTVAVKLTTPIPYFKTLNIDASVDFDEATYQLDQKMPPVAVKVTVDREGKVGKFELNFNIEDKSAALTATVRDVTISADVRIGQADAGHINFDIESPYVNVKIQNKREGSWKQPSNVEASMTIANIDFYSMSGSWDFVQYPQRFNVKAEGSIYSKAVNVEVDGETRGTFDLQRNAKIQLGSMTHEAMVALAGKKLTVSYKNSERRSFNLVADMKVNEDGATRTLTSNYELKQTGYTGLFSSLNWATVYSIPSSVDIDALLENPKENVRKVIRAVVSSVAWDQKLTVDGAEKYSTDGSLKLVMPADSSLVGLKVEYESNRAWADKKYSVVLKVNKPQANVPTDVKLKLEIDGETKVDVTGSVERREKFTKYMRVKLDFDAPKRMRFDVERDGQNENERVWKALYTFDKDADVEGTEWKMTVKPADGVSARGLDLVLVAKRPDGEYLNIEAGYQRSLTKTFEVRVHLFGKTANMPKKYGFREEISYENMALSTKIEFSTLTRDVVAELNTAYEPGKRILIQGVYDLGTPSSRLEVNIERLGEKVTGVAKLGDRTINVDGTMQTQDRHNYEIKVNVRDSDSNAAEFNFRKTWSEQSRNRTFDATLRTNVGEIEWHSHRYLADPIRSRGILVRYRKSEWPAGEETVLYAFGEVDMATPALKVQIMSPFRNADYSVRVERADNGARVVIARMREDDDKVATITLIVDPAHSSFDLLSVRADGSRLKIHGHIVNTKYAFFEAKRMMEEDGTYENLVRITVSLDPTQLHANMKYNTRLAEILREYVARRRDQAKELMGRYKENVPEGLKTLHDITMAEKILKPTVEALRSERKQLREAERAKWREITQSWYESPVMKKMFSNRVPEYAESIIGRWLSDEPMFTAAGVESTLDRAVVAIGQAVRQFMQTNFLPDMKDLRMKMGENSQDETSNRNSIRAIVQRLRETARDYVVEALDRLSKRTWTSCLISYLKALPEKLAERMADREELREVRERLLNAASKARNYFADMKQRYLNADPKTNPLMSSISDTLSKSEINYSAGEVDAKIILPKSDMRSLRVPAAIARKVEGARELLERGIAAVKARLASPTPLRMTIRRALGLMQYFRAGELKMLLL